MLKLFKLIEEFLEKFKDFAFAANIILMVVIIAFMFFWFFDLINHQYLAFLIPVVEDLRTFVHDRFQDTMNKGISKTDGSIFLLILFLGFIVFLIAQLKDWSIFAGKKVSRMVTKIKIKDEDEFNAQLRAEANQTILAYKNVVMIIKLTAKRRFRDDMKSDEAVEKEKKAMEDKLICELYNRIKESPCCKFAKNGDQLVVTLKGFTHVDKLLYYVEKALSDLKVELKKDGWAFKFYAVIDAFDDKALIKDVYYDLQILLKLYLPNEILCYGNFCNRYYLETNNLFEAYLKGVYELTEPENVWSLVKKY